MTRLRGKSFLGLALTGAMVLGVSGMLLALCPEPYNRPAPVMDYVPQEIGIYDRTYQTLTESDCRDCHGSSTSDRHHNTPIVLRDQLCLTCHPTCERGSSPDCPDGILIIRDCLTSGCHSWDDVGPLDEEGTSPNGWHHNTDLSAPRNCVRCHNPNLIGEIGDFQTSSLEVGIPTPFSCENCHWEQAQWATQDPDNPGHPSTYDHFDVWGQFMGFHEYSRPISPRSETHHMGYKSGITSQCDKCHGTGPPTGWDILYCETCHSVSTLHAIPSHVQDHNGWEAIGFHVPFSNDDCTDEGPTVYRTWQHTGPYAPEAVPGFETSDQYRGCHGDQYPTEPPPSGTCSPYIDTTPAGMTPICGSPGVIVTLIGECFGEEHRYMTESSVQFKKKPDGDVWFDMPILSWADTLIDFEIPYHFLSPGNYWVRVRTSSGHSNERVFSLGDG